MTKSQATLRREADARYVHNETVVINGLHWTLHQPSRRRALRGIVGKR